MEVAINSGPRYTFLGMSTDHSDLVCMRVVLKEALSFDGLQRLFEDLYLQRRLRPDHLFLAEQDHRALGDDAVIAQMARWKSWQYLSRELGIDFDEKPPEHPGLIAELCNYGAGSYVHLVTLPGLARGSVIVGFFK